MTGTQRDKPKLTKISLQNTLVLRVLRAVSLVLVIAPVAVIAIALLTRVFGDTATTFTTRGVVYTPGRSSVGSSGMIVWVFSFVIWIRLRRKREIDAVIGRNRRLRKLRIVRGKKSVRRAAAIVARDFNIPDDVTIYAQALSTKNRCPMLIRLSTENQSWVLERSAEGWTYAADTVVGKLGLQRRPPQ
jgi:hypothetical protein